MARTRAAEVDAAIRRGRSAASPPPAQAAAPPAPAPEPIPPSDAEAFDQLDALYEHLAAVQAGGSLARLDVYKVRPIPPDFRGNRMWLDSLEDLRAVDNLEREVIRIAQAAGNAGEILVQLVPKVRNERGIWQYDSPTVTLGLFVPVSEAAAAARAATTPGAPVTGPAPFGVKDVFEVARQIDERTAAPPPPDPLEFLVKAKQAGLIGDSTAEKIVPLIPSITAFMERVFAPRQSPYDKFVEGLIQREFRDSRAEREEPPAEPESATDRLAETRAIMEMAASMFGIGSGERQSVGVEAVRVIGPLIPRALELVSNPINNAINFARERMYYYGGVPPRRIRAPAPAAEPSPAAGAPGMPEAGTPAAELVAVLDQAAPWAEANDERRFGDLLAALCARVAGCAGMLNELQGGRIDEAAAYGMLGQLGVEVVEPLAGYLRRFLGWVRRGAGAASAPAAAPAPPAAAAPPTAPVAEAPPTSAAIVSPATVIDAPVIGRCNRCGAEYNYPSLAVLKGDQDPCDTSLNGGRCGGRILPIGEGR